MSELRPVDRIEVPVIVDNSTDGLSTTPGNVEAEFGFVTRRGSRASSARCLCCAVHGFACVITAFRGDERHAVLFDSGPEDYAFERNVTRLGVSAPSTASCCRMAISGRYRVESGPSTTCTPFLAIVAPRCGEL